MDIQFYGANCLSIGSATSRVVTDDNLNELGSKSVLKSGDIALFTGPHKELKAEVKLIIDGPGEYEVSDFTIQGIPARAQLDQDGKKTATIYKLLSKDTSLLVVGHINPNLKESELEHIGTIDVLFVPVGGYGFTLEPSDALQLVKKLDPKIVIPTHYADNKLNYPTPQLSLDEALHALAMEPSETTPRLKLKPASLTESIQLVVLERAK